MTDCSAWNWTSWRWTAAPPRRPVVARLPDPAQWTAANRAGTARSPSRPMAARWSRWLPRPIAATTGWWRRPWTPSAWPLRGPPSQWGTVKPPWISDTRPHRTVADSCTRPERTPSIPRGVHGVHTVFLSTRRSVRLFNHHRPDARPDRTWRAPLGDRPAGRSRADSAQRSGPTVRSAVLSGVPPAARSSGRSARGDRRPG